MLMDEVRFGERFTFLDVGDVLTEMPLREMTAVEVLRARRWHSEEADRIVRATPRGVRATNAEVAAVKKALRLMDLLVAAMPEWPDDMVVGEAAHRYWPGGRPAS